MNFIYNVFGLIVPVTKGPVQEIGLSYLLNGKTIFTSEDMRNKTGHGFFSGFPNTQYPLVDLARPIFGVNVLGVVRAGINRSGLPEWVETAYKNTALVGYAISSVSRRSTSVALPPKNDIEALIPKLLEDFREKLDLEVNPADLGLHLFWNY